jgi:hypothetical protein
MTTYYPISNTVPQYQTSTGALASGYVLKAYRAGTSTVISMATDYTGATTATSIALNASGYPVVSSNVVIPHLAEDYKFALYPTQAAADANSGAIWTVDNIRLSNISNAERLVNYAADSGSANAYVISPDPSISAYAAGQIVTLKAATANTGASTLQISGLATKNILFPDGSSLYSGAIKSGGVYSLMYDGTQFILMNQQMIFSDSLFTIQANSDATKKVQFQASGVTTATTRTLTVPDASTTLVGHDNTQTLTNKTLTSPTITTPAISTGTLTDCINAGFKRSSTQLDKTSNTTLEAIAGLSISLTAGGTYKVRAFLPCTSGASGGVKVALATTDTLTLTSSDLTGFVFNTAASPVIVHTTAGLGTSLAASTQIALAVQIEGTLIVNAAGTLVVQGAQNASNGTTTSFYVGGTLEITRIA